MQLHNFLRARGLLGCRHIRRRVYNPLGSADAVHIAELHLFIYLQNRTRNHAPHVLCVRIAAVCVVKARMQTVCIAAHRVHIHVVHVALRAVKEHASHVVQRRLGRLAHKAREVRRNLVAAHHVRVYAKVGNYNIRRALAHKAQHVHPLVYIADRRNDIGVIHAGICAD